MYRHGSEVKGSGDHVLRLYYLTQSVLVNENRSSAHTKWGQLIIHLSHHGNVFIHVNCSFQKNIPHR